MFVRLAVVAALALAGTALVPVPQAQAQTCTFTPTTLAFGSINTLANAPVPSTSTITINCSGFLLSTVLVCLNLGAGTGGASSATARQMASGTNLLNYQIYTDPARTTVWGTYTWAYPSRAQSVQVPLLLGLGTGSATVTLYGSVFAGQQTAAIGSYLSQFAGADVEFRYRYLDTSGCNTGLGTLVRPTFNVTANVPSNCLVSASDIDFGPRGVLRTNIDVTGSVAVTCTAGTTYNVSLNGGQSNTAPAVRRMTKGGEFVTYGLYTNSQRTQAWGNTTIGGTTVSGTGTGVAQSIPVYARVPPQTTPSAGNYADVVVVTVTY